MCSSEIQDCHNFLFHVKSLTNSINGRMVKSFINFIGGGIPVSKDEADSEWDLTELHISKWVTLKQYVAKDLQATKLALVKFLFNFIGKMEYLFIDYFIGVNIFTSKIDSSIREILL